MATVLLESAKAWMKMNSSFLDPEMALLTKMVLSLVVGRLVMKAKNLSSLKTIHVIHAPYSSNGLSQLVRFINVQTSSWKIERVSLSYF